MRISDWSSDVCSSDLAIDVALRARSSQDQDSSMIVRSLGTSRLVLAMSPVLRDKLGDVTTVAQLAQCPTLSMSDAAEDHWQLVGTSEDRKSTRLNSSH